jgi:alanine racemase
MPDFDPPARLCLNMEALVSNWRSMANMGTAACGAAVKANAYGLGAREVVAQLRDAGCRDFFVAHWAEALQLVDLVRPDQIAVLNGITGAEIAIARRIGALPVLNTAEQIALWRESGGGKCHVMLDSGINRLGLSPEQRPVELCDGLDIDILMSHLASADDDVPQNAAQRNLFVAMARGISAYRLSLSNSAAIMLGKDYHFDLTRPGISLYGGIPRAELKPIIQPVLAIKTRALQIRDHIAGSAIGYDGTYICSRDTKVATCGIGYADGYWRGFSNAGEATFGDAKLPVIGRISMDMVTFDASFAVGIQEGDWIDISFALDDAAAQSGMSQYELLTGLGNRFERVWT